MDLNLLVVASALFRTRNATRAADELGVSQSAVSHALRRLRAQFGDPFFVRTAKGLAPTELARSLEREINALVAQAELLADRRAKFDPKLARGRITVVASDYIEVVVMPELQKVLAREAPGVQVSIRPTLGVLPARDLEEGRACVTISGAFEKLPEGFYRTKLFTDTFSCAMRAGHPLAAPGNLDADAYFGARHALITLEGDFRDDITRRVRGKIQEREILYGSHSFTGLAWVLQETDLLLTAPTQLLRRYAQNFPIRLVDCPVDQGGFGIQMIWHAQSHENPLRRWIRARIKEICARL